LACDSLKYFKNEEEFKRDDVLIEITFKEVVKK